MLQIIELARQRDIVPAHLVSGMGGAEDGHAEADEPVASADATARQPLDLRAWMRDLAEMPLSRLWIGLGRAVQEERADAALQQAVDGRVGMRGGRIVVAPIDHGGDAGVELAQDADEIGDDDVLRREARRDARMHGVEIFGDRPIGGDATQAGLPGMDMRVDQAEHDDAVCGIDDLGVLARDLLRHRGDARAIDQHVAPAQIRHHIVERDDNAGFDQPTRHPFPAPCDAESELPHLHIAPSPGGAPAGPRRQSPRRRFTALAAAPPTDEKAIARQPAKDRLTQLVRAEPLP